MNTTSATTHRPGATAHPPARRTLAIIAATITMLLAFVSVAQAGARGFEEAQLEEGLFYANFDEDILLFVGSTAEDFCNEVEPTHDARVFHRSDGSVDIKVDASEQPIYLYSSELGAPELIEATCEAMNNGEPTLQPFAEGEGLVRMRIEIAPEGTVHVVNSTVGAASSTDGTTWRVRGWADLMIVDDAPVGDPADFQGLRAVLTGA